MSALSDQLKKINEGSRGKSSGQPAPRASSLLVGQLKKINAAANPAAAKAAADAARGGGGPLASVLHGLSLVQVPMRGIVAAGDELGGLLGGPKDKESWLQKVKDPSYGFGRVVEKAAPGLPWPVKSGLGLAGDVLFDPLTYATFGASAGVKAAGKSEGLLRFIGEATKWGDEAARAAKIVGRGDEAEQAFKSVQELKNIGERLSEKGTLARKDLKALEDASKAMAEAPPADIMEAAKAFGKEVPAPLTNPDLNLGQAGVHFHVPFRKDLEWTLPGTEGIGRGLEGTGYKVSGKLTEKVPWASGSAAKAAKMIRSGDYETAVSGAWLKAAVRQGRAAATDIMEHAGRESGKAVDTMIDHAVPGQDLFHGLSERPMTERQIAKATKDMTEEEATAFLSNPRVTEGGKAWQDLIARGPEVEKAARQIGGWYDEVPHNSMLAAAHGTSRRAFIANAEDNGRWAYVPRTASDEFRALREAEGASVGQAVRPQPGKDSWFQRAGHTVGDVIGEGTENPTTLVDPGTVTERYAQGAPGLERQVEDAVPLAYGEQAAPWYETDFYKAHDKYIAGLAKQTGDQRIQNFLLSKGVSRPNLAASLAESRQMPKFSGWREDLYGDFHPVTGKRMSYSDKVLNQTEYRRLQVLSKSDDPLINAEIAQWNTVPSEMAKKADAQLNNILDDMDRMMLTDKGIKKVEIDNLQKQYDHWQKARDLFQQAAEEGPDGPRYERLLLAAARSRIEASIVGHEQSWSRLVKDKDFITRMNTVLSSGWEGYGFARQAPSDVVDVLKDIANSYNPATGEGLKSFLKVYDGVNNWMKGWLTTSLGFVDRNIFGGSFNNWLAGADVVKSMRGWGPILSARAGERATPMQKVVYGLAEEMGFLGSGMYSSEFGRVAEGKMFDIGGIGQASRDWSLNPGAGIAGGDRTFIAPYMVRRFNEQFAEPMLRGSLFYDRLDKAMTAGRFRSIGVHSFDDLADPAKAAQFVRDFRASGLSDEIMYDIAKYHFDYDDLSRFERQVGRRIIPFYTWTRKNVPLQIEAMFTQPGKALARYAAVKRNLESASTPQDTVPGWFGGEGLMRLPVKFGGNQVYGGIDLPFKDPFQAADVTGFGAGMISPLIKAPIETWAGHQFFGDLPLRSAGEQGGLKPMPKTWIPLIPVLKLADKLPFSPIHAPVKAKNGEWLMAEEDAYLLGQYLPFLAQTQRLVPDTPKSRDRVVSTYLSYLFGVQLRTNTPQDMENEMFSRGGDVTAILNKLKAQGYVKAKTKPRKQPAGPSLTDMLASLDTATP